MYAGTSSSSSINVPNYTIAEGLRKGSRIFEYKDYLYYKNCERKHRTTLRCCSYERKQCTGTAYILKIDNQCHELAPHNHLPDQTDTGVRSLKRAIKNASESELATPRKIFDAVSRNFDDNVIAEVSFYNVCRGMQMRRSRCFPAMPSDRNDLVNKLISCNHLNRYFKDTVYLDGEAAALIFFCDETVRMFDDLRNCCCDGTFSVVPYKFTQLFVISFELGDRYLPLFYVLMTRKTALLYKLVLSKLTSMCPEFSPTMCVSDFESGIIAAFRETFNGIKNRGCLFHLKHSVLKKMKELKLFILYKRNTEFYQWSNLMMGIGFLPSARVMPFFEKLTRSFVCGRAFHQPKLTKLADYYKKVWLKDLSLTDWINAEITTNNFSESTNKRIKAVIKGDRSSPWRFVNKLSLFIQDTRADALRIKNGKTTTRARLTSEVHFVDPELRRKVINNEISDFTYLCNVLDIDPCQKLKDMFA